MGGKASMINGGSLQRLDMVFYTDEIIEQSSVQSIIESWLSRVYHMTRYSGLQKHSLIVSRTLSAFVASIGTSAPEQTKLELFLAGEGGFLVTIGVEQKKDGIIR